MDAVSWFFVGSMVGVLFQGVIGAISGERHGGELKKVNGKLNRLLKPIIEEEQRTEKKNRKERLKKELAELESK